MQEYDISHIDYSSPGTLLKAELKKKGISQKDFAKQLGMLPSHLSEIVRDKRRITMEVADKLEKGLGIPAFTWGQLQLRHNLDSRPESKEQEEERLANQELVAYDQLVSVKILRDRVGITGTSKKQIVTELRKAYSLPSAAELQSKEGVLSKGFFKKSVRTGLDIRMIATWVVLARYSVHAQSVVSCFDKSTLRGLTKELSVIFHQNSNTIIRTRDVLSKYGIKFAVLKRLDHASIDGYSFLDGEVPAIVVTMRFDRIDNFAFAVLHEVCHVYRHLGDKQRQMISIVDYDAEGAEEKEANDYASRALIKSEAWSDAPAVALNKPWIIQREYSNWAERHNLNKWIALGQISHITGMYKFRSDDSRKIH